MDRTPNILIVKDDADIALLVSDFMERDGFTVSRARDGAEADRRIAKRVPDLVLLDLMLPGEDGLSIARRLRADHDLPVIMLTAKTEDTDRIIGLEIGADDYVTKPFNPRELLARVREVPRDMGAMERMIDQGLGFLRQGTEPLAVRRFDLASLARTVVDETAVDPMAEGCERRIEIDGPDRLVVSGDADAMRRAIENVVGNAARHARRTRIEIARDDETAAVTVSDDGPGVPAEERERILQPFQRLNEARSERTGGYGLGLTIARDVVERHGGTLTLRDASMGGPRIDLRVPLATIRFS